MLFLVSAFVLFWCCHCSTLPKNRSYLLWGLHKSPYETALLRAAHVWLYTILGRWCRDELLFHGRKSLSKCFQRYWRANSISQQPADSIGGHTVHVQVILIGGIFFLQRLVEMNIKYSTQPSVCTQHNTMLTALQADTVNVPKEMFPVPVLSNSWKATMNRASGAHRTDSKAKNSWKEISLCGGEREYDGNHYIIRCHHFNVTAISSQDL